VRWWPLVAVAVLAAALRWFRIDAQSLWYDEGISAFQLTRSFPDIVRAAALDTHPPGYYWTLKAWADLFGGSELGLRSLSAFWGVVCVVLTYLLGRRLFQNGLIALVGALLLAVAPLAVYYAQEVRMYTQVTALGLLAVYGYVLRRWWLYALAAVATLYSQYLGAALLIAANVHAVLWWRSLSRREWMWWLGANALVALAFVPWLPTFVDQQSHALNTRPRTPLGLALDSFTALGGGIVKDDAFLLGGMLLVGLAVLGLLAALVRRGSGELRAATLLGLLWVLPLGLVLALGLRSGLFEVRYLLLSLPGMLLLAAVGLVQVARHPLAIGAVAGLVMLPAALALRHQYFDPALARDDYRGLVAEILRDAEPTDAVVLSAPNQTEVFGYYYKGPLPTIGLPAQRPIDPADTEARLAAIKSEYRRVWLVSWAMPEADPRGVISTWLAANGFAATHQWYGSVQLALVGFGTADAPTTRVDAAFDNGIVLDAFRQAPSAPHPGDTLALTLVWRASQGPTAQRWKVFTHILDADSRVVAQRDAEPVDNLRPTTTWARGEQIEDNYGLALPETLPPGEYTLEIGMYDGDTRAKLTTGGDHVILAKIRVDPG
jgi:uncharacterized membrane protein